MLAVLTHGDGCFGFKASLFAIMTCFHMSSDGRKSIHLFDEKSSNHSDNPGRHTECSDPVWAPPQMGMRASCCRLQEEESSKHPHRWKVGTLIASYQIQCDAQQSQHNKMMRPSPNTRHTELQIPYEQYK